MTGREFVALQLLWMGAACAVAAGYGYGGWRGACVVAAVLLLAFGILLALDSSPRPEQLDDTEEEPEAEDRPQMGGPWSGGGVTPAHPYGQEAS